MNDTPLIEPTTQNARRYTALLFASVTAITLAGMIALVSIKPQLYMASQGSSNQPLVQEIPTLIADCHLIYTGCQDQQHSLDTLNLASDTATLLHQWGQTYNINPQVAVTLARLQNHDVADTSKLKPIFEELSVLNSRIPQELPKVYNHPALGTFKLTAPTHDTLVLVNYAAMAATSKQAFISIVTTANPEGPTFITTFKNLFQTDPTAQ